MNSNSRTLLNFFVTCISIAAALPGLKENDLRVAMLTFLVLFLSKLIASVNLCEQESNIHNLIFVFVESIMDILGVAVCLHFLFISSTSESCLDEIEKYSILKNCFYYRLIFIVSAVHIILDFSRCGVSFIKSIKTRKRINLINE